MSVKVTVPATTANLGAGFDCIGAALSRYNRFEFSLLDADSPKLQMTVSGAEAAQVSTDESNLVYQSFAKVYASLGKTPPPVKIAIELGIPLARGLGSSATAIVGGLVGANVLAGNPLRKTEIMEMAIAMEGHPDNVVPAFLGGCRLAADRTICEIPWHSNVIPVIAIPNFELSTEAARSVLPTEISRADAIFNIAHLGLFLRALETGNHEWLRVALQDKLHQPYRKHLIPGYDAVREAAIAAGADEMVISGAGPTLLALTKEESASAVANAMQKAWETQGIQVEARSLSLDTQGARWE
ncbi:MAG: homoserine kinase [Chroococcales cyanobacterium]